jgi:hypothetical protein
MTNLNIKLNLTELLKQKVYVESKEADYNSGSKERILNFDLPVNRKQGLREELIERIEKEHEELQQEITTIKAFIFEDKEEEILAALYKAKEEVISEVSQ